MKIEYFISIIKTSNVFVPKRLIYLTEIEDFLKNYIVVSIQDNLPMGLLFHFKSIRRLSVYHILKENISGLSCDILVVNHFNLINSILPQYDTRNRALWNYILFGLQPFYLCNDLNHSSPL